MIRLAKRVRELLSCYSQYSYGRDRFGIPCDPIDPKAESWCFFGALRRAAHELDTHWQERQAFTMLLQRVNPYPFGLMQVNDTLGKDAICALVEMAIVEIERRASSTRTVEVSAA